MDRKPVVSFSFSKKKESAPIVAPTKILCKDVEDKKRDVEFVTSLCDREIISTKSEPVHKELVIPLIQNNNWRLHKAVRSGTKTMKEENREEEELMVKRELTLEEKAQQELKSEAKRFADEQADRLQSQSDRVIPIFMTNRVPEGFEGDDEFDVSARAENPTPEDYEQVPVQEFGMAMLRGMGFKAEDAKKVPVVEVKIRPKGLGLGAEIPVPVKAVTNGSSSSSHRKEEQLELKIGAQVYVAAGKQKGFYGVVEGFDEDMLQADVRLAIGNMSVDIPIVFLRLVSSDEFRKESKVLNKCSFEDYQEKSGQRAVDGRSNGHRLQSEELGLHSRDHRQEERKWSRRREEAADKKSWRNKESRRSDEEADGDDGYYDKKAVKGEDRAGDRSRTVEGRKKLSADDENAHHEENDHQLSSGRRHRPHRHREEDESQKDTGSKDRKDDGKFNPLPVKEEVIQGGEIDHQKQNRRHHHHHGDRHNDSDRCWLRPGLRARIIDPHFGHGKFLNQKVQVIDVTSPGTCTVVTDERLLVNHVTASMLETVVPHDTGAKVMILKGSLKYEIAILLRRDSKRQEAQVQLLSDPQTIRTYSFDHVCQFVCDGVDQV